MEVAGLTVGIIALIGVAKECVDLFSYISVARSQGRDFELLSTKLEVEKVLLLQWIQRTRLLQEDCDSRLAEPTVLEAVQRVVNSIRLLLSDAKTLRKRYGMRESEATNEISRIIFEGRMSSFAQDSQQFGARLSDFTEDSARLDQLTTRLASLGLRLSSDQVVAWGGEVGDCTISSKKPDRLTDDLANSGLRVSSHQIVVCSQRVRWAVRDKNKFDDLLQQLSYFISRLDSLLPAKTDHVRASMTEEDIRPLKDSKIVRLLAEAGTGRNDIFGSTAEFHHQTVCEGRILSCIWYRLMDDRRDALSPPNPRTFEWALDQCAPKYDGDSLADWLEDGSGIYWICGRAGSGKSTLMKYAYAHSRTKKLLSNWAGETPLTIISAFFWYLGTELQKSQEGLSRALLYKILDSDHSLIRQLLPNMWTDAYNSDRDVLLPSPSETQVAFEKLGQLGGPRRKFCLFIDGLDEYSGRVTNGINFLQTLAKNPNIKLVISSRPIPSCVEAFSKVPMLRLQDLTAGDIITYVDQTVFSHSYLQLLDTEGESQIQILRQNLVGKANGVFLWVVLACRSLRDGLDNFDHFSDLEKRIDELPPELEELFHYMLSRIEARYVDHAIKLIRICHQNQLHSNTESISALGLALTDDHEMNLNKLPKFQSMKEPRKRKFSGLPAGRSPNCKILEGRLRSHCFGLIEVKRIGATSEKDCFCDNTRARGGTQPRSWPVAQSKLQGKTGQNRHSTELATTLPDHPRPESADRIAEICTVEFLHRTLFDFLLAGGLKEIEDRMRSYDTFDPNPVLCCISLHTLRMTENITQAMRYVKDLLIHAGNIDPDRYSQVDLVLTTLYDWVVTERIPYLVESYDMFSYAQADGRYWADRKSIKHHLGLCLAVELGIDPLLRLYDKKIAKLAELPFHLPLLWRALSRPLTKTMVQEPGGGHRAGESVSRSGVERPWILVDSRCIRITRFLITCGCNPNEQFIEADRDETTHWKYLLQRAIGGDVRDGDSEYELLFEILELYLRAGADSEYAMAYCASRALSPPARRVAMFVRNEFLRNESECSDKHSPIASKDGKKSGTSYNDQTKVNVPLFSARLPDVTIDSGSPDSEDSSPSEERGAGNPSRRT